MKKVVAFLSELYDNNYKEWFDAHKGEYLDAKGEFEDFVNQLIKGIYAFDPAVGMQDAKKCCYRIYRDMRFSPDKIPYKSWMGGYICPGGKKSSLPGYYFHVQPKGNYLSGHLIAVGLYNPDKRIVKAIRDGILYEGERFVHALDAAAKAGLVLDDECKMKICPPGYPKDSPYADYFKYRNFCLTKKITVKDFNLPALLSYFKAAYEFRVLLNEFMNA